MKNIVPFRKDVKFKTNLNEITSISLENTLNLKNNSVTGDFIVSGEYKVSDKSTTVEPFSFNLPFEILIDDRYDSNKATIDIDDFYYEIINNDTLSISIDVLIDHLSDKPLIEKEEFAEENPVRITLEEMENSTDKRCIEDESIKEAEIVEEEVIDILDDRKEESEMVEEKINSIFSSNSLEGDTYVTYNVFIIREGDTLESILEKYNITEDELKKYNDLSELKLGDKLIIPNTYEGN